MENIIIKSLILLFNLDFGRANADSVFRYRIFENMCKIIRAMKRNM